MTKDEILKAAKMITKDDVLNAAKCYAGDNCENCPLEHRGYETENCVEVFANYILYNIKENEPAPAATGTSSEVVSKDTDNIHIDDSTLLDICQEELEAISEIALNDYPNGYLTGYIVALKNNTKRLRGEHSD